MGFGADLPKAEGGGEEGEPSPMVVDEGEEAEGGVIESECIERGMEGVHGVDLVSGGARRVSI